MEDTPLNIFLEFLSLLGIFVLFSILGFWYIRFACRSAIRQVLRGKKCMCSGNELDGYDSAYCKLHKVDPQ